MKTEVEKEAMGPDILGSELFRLIFAAVAYHINEYGCTGESEEEFVKSVRLCFARSRKFITGNELNP